MHSKYAVSPSSILYIFTCNVWYTICGVRFCRCVIAQPEYDPRKFYMTPNVLRLRGVPHGRLNFPLGGQRYLNLRILVDDNVPTSHHLVSVPSHRPTKTCFPLFPTHPCRTQTTPWQWQAPPPADVAERCPTEQYQAWGWEAQCLASTYMLLAVSSRACTECRLLHYRRSLNQVGFRATTNIRFPVFWRGTALYPSVVVWWEYSTSWHGGSQHFGDAPVIHPCWNLAGNSISPIPPCCCTSIRPPSK